MEAWTKLQLLKYMNEIWQATARENKIYESFELLFQSLNSKDAEEIFGVLIRYLLSATDEKPEHAEEKVNHLPNK